MFRGGGFKTHSRSIAKSKIGTSKITPSKPKASIPSQPKAPPVKEVHHHHVPASSSGGSVIPFVMGAAIGHLLTKDSSEPAVKIAPGEPKENKEEEKKK